MKRTSRRRFVGAAGSTLAAVGVGTAATSGVLEREGASDGFDADASSYLPLVLGDDWLERALGISNAGRIVFRDPPERTGTFEVSYTEPGGLNSVRDVISPVSRESALWVDEGLHEHVDFTVRTTRDGLLTTVAPISDDSAVLDVLEADGESFTAVEGFDGHVHVDGGWVEAVSESTYVELGPLWMTRPEAREPASELRRAAVTLASTRQRSFEPATADERALAAVLEDVGAPTYVRAGRALLQESPPATNIAPEADVTVPGVEMAGMGFDVGTEWTRLRRVLHGDDLDLDAVLAANDARPSMSTYEGVDATRVEEGVWVTGRTPTKYVDFLRTGLPYPRTTFTFGVDSDADSVTVRCTDGPSLPAGRLRLRWWSEDDADDRWLAAPHWQPKDSQVQPGDAMQLEIPDAARHLSLELVWETRGETEVDWQGLAWLDLEA